MKSIHTIFTATCCLLVISFASVLKAGERLMAIEMADGKIVTFTMSPEEIAAEDAIKTKLDRRRSSTANRPTKRVVIYEMGESGHIVSFPMTEKEIIAENALLARQKERLVSYTRKAEPEYEKIELAESGRYLIFPITNEQRNSKDAVEIAKHLGE